MNPLYYQACLFFQCPLVDRTETLDSGLNLQLLQPIEAWAPISDSFEELCAQRAREIITLSAGRRITVLWSGGIDSTAVLIALYRELSVREERDRLHLLLSQESIDEFPAFFEAIIQDKLAYTRIESTIYEQIDPADLNITGEHGDQLFGSDKLKYHVMTGEAWRPWEDNLEYVIAHKLGHKAPAAEIIEYLRPQVAQSPLPINTLYDYLWWMNFSLKWQHVSLRLREGLTTGAFALEDNLCHFFQSTDFQRWSLSNPQSKIKSDWKSYKYIAKEYIHDFFPNEDYLLNKEKEQSLKLVIVRR
ncbi:MAG: hypothetical protein AB8H47_20315 [Bacteroidia bacterium]